MLDAKLVIVAGAETELDYELQLPTTIGRSRENDIALPHPLVSRHHCELFELEGKLYVRDLGSLNGTFVGNKPVPEETEVLPGQLLTVGTVTFRAVYADYRSALDGEEHDAELDLATSSGDTVRADGATTMIAPRKGMGTVGGQVPVAADADADSEATINVRRMVKR